MIRLLTVLIFAAGLASIAHAGTIVVTIAGFTNLPATTPTLWPGNFVYPGGASPNTSRTYTMNDADFQSMLTWLAATQFSGGTAANPLTSTAPQIWQTWPQIWINGTKQSVAQFFTTPSQAPAPITIQ